MYSFYNKKKSCETTMHNKLITNNNIYIQLNINT